MTISTLMPGSGMLSCRVRYTFMRGQVCANAGLMYDACTFKFFVVYFPNVCDEKSSSGGILTEDRRNPHYFIKKLRCEMRHIHLRIYYYF